MDNIEEIWNKGNEEISKDKTFSPDFIKKSISDNSISISSKLLKTIRMGIVIASISVTMFVYNMFFYLKNPGISITIIGGVILSILIIIYLITQAGIVKKTDARSIDLHSLLAYKIKYFRTRFQIVLHCLSLSIVLVTFTLNLTMENTDGVFEIRKILILSVYYVFAYLVTLFLSKVIHSVYLKQLKNALFNLEENTLDSIEEEMLKYKKIRRIILIMVSIALIMGVIFLLVKSGT